MTGLEVWDFAATRRESEGHALAIATLRGAESRQNERSSSSEGSVIGDPKAEDRRRRGVNAPFSQMPEDRGGGKPISRYRRVKHRDWPEPENELEAHYLRYAQAEAMSVETMRQRIYLLRGLGKLIPEVTGDDIVAMLNARGLSASSRAAYITVLKATFADLLRLGLVERDPLVRIKTPRTPRRRPRPLTAEQLAALETLPHDRREYAWTVLGSYAGMRAGEICRMRGDWLTYGPSGAVLRIEGKGGLVAEVPAHPKVIEVLKPYEGLPDAIWPMWPQSLNRAWQRAAASVGVEGVVFHQCRHSFATRLTRAGVDLLVIAEVCRHASVATTQRYAKVADDAPMQAVVGL